MLPQRGSPEDAYRVVEYLQTKPTGEDLSDIRATLQDNLTTGRKLRTFEEWGVIDSTEGNIKLEPEARDLTDEDYRSDFFKEVIVNIHPYQKAIESVYHNGKGEITKTEVATFFYENFPDVVGTESNDVLEEMATCFFKVCEEAGLGDYVVGRKGKSTRLEIKDNKVSEFVSNYIHSAPEQVTSTDSTNEEVSQSDPDQQHVSGDDSDSSTEETLSASQVQGLRGEKGISPSLHIDIAVHISPDANAEQIDQIFESMANHLGDL